MTQEEEQILAETFEAANKRIEELEAHLSSKSQECEELQKQMDFSNQYKTRVISDLNSYNNDLTEDRDKLRAENDRLKGDIEFYMERMGKAATALQLQEDMIENKRKRCEDLEAERVNIKQENVDLKHHCIKMEAERDNLQSIKNKLLSVKKELDEKWKENPQWTLYEYKKWAYDHIMDSLFDDENF